MFRRRSVGERDELHLTKNESSDARTLTEAEDFVIDNSMLLQEGVQELSDD